MEGALALLSVQPQVSAPGEEAGSGDKGLWSNYSQRSSALPNQGQGYTHHLPLTCQLDPVPHPSPRPSCIPDKGGSAGLSASSLSLQAEGEEGRMGY